MGNSGDHKSSAPFLRNREPLRFVEFYSGVWWMRVCARSPTPGRAGPRAARAPGTPRLRPRKVETETARSAERRGFSCRRGPSPRPGTHDLGQREAGCCPEPDSGAGGLLFFPDQLQGEYSSVHRDGEVRHFLQRAPLAPPPLSPRPFVLIWGEAGEKDTKSPPPWLHFQYPPNGKEYISLHGGFSPTGQGPHFQFPT